MIPGTYQCYSCGWSGNDPDIREQEESWEIVKGHWQHKEKEFHYICPDCGAIFSVIKEA